MAVKRNKNGVVYFSVRYKDIYGVWQRKKQESKAWKTLKEGKEAEDKFLESVKIGADMPLFRLYALYYNNLKNVRDSTLKNYESEYTLHIHPYLGNTPINKINNLIINDWQIKMYNQGFSNAMLNKIQMRLKATLEFGVSYEILSRNPFTIPFIQRDEEKQEMQTWTLEEFNAFYSVINRICDKAFFSLLYFTGMRIGEILGLTLADYQNKSVNIDKQLNIRGKKAKPKSDNSYRVLRLPDNVCDILDKMLDEYGIDDRTSQESLWCCMRGKSRREVAKRKDKYCVKANVKQIRLHDFRHSHATMLLHLGFDYVDVAKRLGDTPYTIVNTYGHTYGDSDSRIQDSLNKIVPKSYHLFLEDSENTPKNSAK